MTDFVEPGLALTALFLKDLSFHNVTKAWSLSVTWVERRSRIEFILDLNNKAAWSLSIPQGTYTPRMLWSFAGTIQTQLKKHIQISPQDQNAIWSAPTYAPPPTVPTTVFASPRRPPLIRKGVQILTSHTYATITEASNTNTQQ